MDSRTQNSLQSSLRILGVLLLVLIFTLQAQASFPLKAKTDVTSALQSAEQELKDVVKSYEFSTQQRIAFEEAEIQQSVNQITTAYHSEKRIHQVQ